MHEAAIHPPDASLSLTEKLRVVLACGVAVLIMCTVGWLVAGPADPLMPVVLVEGWGRVAGVWPALTALTVVCALVGMVMSGRRAPEAGILAAAVGLAGLALRGGSMEALLAYESGADLAGRRALMTRMAFDAVLWAAMLAVAWVALEIARRWLWDDSPDAARASEKGAGAGAAPVWSRGWPALAITVVVALFLIWLMIARSPVAQSLRGQTIASVAVGLGVGAMAARYFAGVHDPRWYVVAPMVVALIGYLLGYLNAEMNWAQGGPYQPYAALATTPPHNLVRPLPVEYLAVGVAAAMIGYWSGEKIEHAAEQEAG